MGTTPPTGGVLGGTIITTNYETLPSKICEERKNWNALLAPAVTPPGVGGPSLPRVLGGADGEEQEPSLPRVLGGADRSICKSDESAVDPPDSKEKPRKNSGFSLESGSTQEQWGSSSKNSGEL